MLTYLIGIQEILFFVLMILCYVLIIRRCSGRNRKPVLVGGSIWIVGQILSGISLGLGLFGGAVISEAISLIGGLIFFWGFIRFLKVIRSVPGAIDQDAPIG